VDSVIIALKESGVVVNEEGLRDTFKELKKHGKSINFKEFKAIAFKSFGENEDGENIKMIERCKSNNYEIIDYKSKESIDIENIKNE